MAEPSTRAKWRALRSARISTPKKCLTPPTLSETRFIANSGGGFNQPTTLYYTASVFRAIRLSAIQLHPCKRREGCGIYAGRRISLTQSESHPGVKRQYEAVSKVCSSSHRRIVRHGNVPSVRVSANRNAQCICLRNQQTSQLCRTRWLERRFHGRPHPAARFAILDINHRIGVSDTRA